MAPVRKLKIAKSTPRARQAKDAVATPQATEPIDVPARRRDSLRALLHLQDVQSVARAAAAFSAKELAFDKDLLPALEFLEIMGTSCGQVFTDAMRDLALELAGHIQNAPPSKVLEVLKDIDKHCGSAKIASLVLPALQRLGTSKEADAVTQKVFRVLSQHPEELQRIPQALQQRVWEASECLWRPRLQAQLADLISQLRRSTKPQDMYSDVFKYVTSLSGTSMRQLCKFVTDIHREAASYKTATLREPV
eukprot:s329_g1.t1